MYKYLPNTHIISIRQPQVRQPQEKPRGDGWGVEGHVHCADMPDMPARHARQTRPARHARQTRPARPGQLWRKTFTFTFTFIFPGDKNKTRQDPCSMEGSLVFVATAYRLPPRRWKETRRDEGTCVCLLGGWVTREEIFLFWGACFDGDG